MFHVISSKVISFALKKLDAVQCMPVERKFLCVLFCIEGVFEKLKLPLLLRVLWGFAHERIC
ncbi:hypothetical protein AT238_07350 [Bartonella henselae]|nr:hypothetical protein BhenCHDE101_07455 [Bartonella henselae]OLL53277.1 hypothetical protein AT238_07350 [Bartonella henselae]